MTEPLLSVRNLSVAFHQGGKSTLAVDDISFDIGHGEVLALVGESGSGKSVSANSILKLLPYPAASHPSGSVVFDGRDLMTLQERDLRSVRGNLGNFVTIRCLWQRTVKALPARWLTGDGRHPSRHDGPFP